ncbi:integrin alpha-11 isoform X2 [Bombina bombina]|uniref:integrin alpha-11 isoform X2 n=1 Tax=Bombina bombina TaxID=8345 RepID=UPI00235AD87E|nr:integrin alpha-11 isoform X2 [Bombina bombina]
MDFLRGFLTAWALCLLPGFTDTFNIDNKRPRIIPGSKDAFFGYTVQQHQIGDKKWLVVGAPFEMNAAQKTGDIYRCSVTNETSSDCTKLGIGRVTLSNVSERKDNMRLGMSLVTNPKDNSFVACSPLWSHECGSSYYTTGMCSRVNSNFRFSRIVAPALQRCPTFMDIVIVLDGSNSIYPWAEVQSFLISILQKFYIAPGQIQVGVLQYGEDVVHEFHLNNFRSVSEVVEAAKGIEQRGGTETRTALGIEKACTEAFQHGARKGAKKVMIVITDGESHDSPDLERVIETCEKDNITRYAVAVLGYYNRRGINPEAFLNEIKFIASDPDDKHFFNVTDEAALKDIVDALGERIFSLEGGTNKNETSFGLEMSQAGFSSHVVEDGILLGAVGAYDWNGAVLKETSSGKVIPRRESYLREFPDELKNHGAYLGYTVTSVMTSQRGRLYVAGAPRFNHTGKVIIFSMQGMDNLIIHQALKGEQIGSYFGSEIDSVDVDNDGLTDVLLVGAPMYFSDGWERGRVSVYVLKERRFVHDGVLRDSDSSQNSRFGSSIVAVPDLNQDSYNDVVIGSPLEDEHKGAIYIFHGMKKNILKRHKQRISAAELSPGLKYFGCSIHGKMDMNDDGLVDLAVGSMGNAVLLWTRSVVQINATIRFEPPKINMFHKDCHRNGREATCMAAFICFLPMFKAAQFQGLSVAIKYNVTIDERRYTPRAVIDDIGGDKHFVKTLRATSGHSQCQQLNFHVLDTADYSKPITFSLEYELAFPNEGPVLEEGWPTSHKVSVPFWNGCNQDERCVPDLSIDVKHDIPTAMEFCRRNLRRSPSDCATFVSSFDTSVFIIEGSRRRVALEAMLENKGENAYSTVLNISCSRNLQFASLIIKEESDIKIECKRNERTALNKICNVSYPFFRSKAKVAFRLDFEFSKSFFLPSLQIHLTASSESEELEDTRADNKVLLNFNLKYESDLMFTRYSTLDQYEVTSGGSVDRYNAIGPPFNCTFKIQNLGFFPEEITLKITVPIATRGGNRLLLLQDLISDQVKAECNIWGNNTDYRRKPSEEDLSLLPQLNYSNSDAVSIDCTMTLASNQEAAFILQGQLWSRSFRVMKFRSLSLALFATLERKFHSPFIFREEEPTSQITFDISKQEEWEVPIWIIVSSTLGGLLLLALLVLALWKLGFFKRSHHEREEEDKVME